MTSYQFAKIEKLRNMVQSTANEYAKAKDALDKAVGNYFDHASYARKYYGFPNEQAAERKKAKK
jgi:hypothetical protein